VLGCTDNLKMAGNYRMNLKEPCCTVQNTIKNNKSGHEAASTCTNTCRAQQEAVRPWPVWHSSTAIRKRIGRGWVLADFGQAIHRGQTAERVLDVTEHDMEGWRSRCTSFTL